MKKIALIFLSLFVVFGAIAQIEPGKEYRIRDVDSGLCLNVLDHNEHKEVLYGGVNVVALDTEPVDMFFTVVAVENGYKLIFRDGY